MENLGIVNIISPHPESLVIILLIVVIAILAAALLRRRRVEKNLRESEEKYRLLVENAGEVIVVFQGDRIKFANPAATEISGYSFEELTSSPFLEFIHPDDREMVWQNYLNKLQGQSTPHVSHFRCLHKNGDVQWVELKDNLIIWQGQPATLNCITDITEQKVAEEALRIERRILKEILEATLAGYWDWDVRAGREYLSPTYKRMFGYAEDELADRPGIWKELIFPEDLPLVRETFRRHVASRGEVPYYNEVRYRHKNGSTVWVISTGKVIAWDEAGKPLRMVGCLVDITASKQAEQELRESEARFRLLVENAPDAIFIQKAGRFDYANKEALRLFGAASEDQLTGQPVMGRVHPDCRGQFLEEIRVLHNERKALPRLELQYLKVDGPSFDVEVSGVPFRLKGEDCALIFFRDITERKQAEENRKALTVQLFQAQKMEALGTLAGGIAHDFNNVLGAMLGFAELTDLELLETSKGHAFLENLLKAGGRARHLVKQMLSFSRQAPGARQPLSLTPVVKETMKFLRAAIPTTIEIHTRFAAEKDTVLADPVQIYQVLLNLATNAAQAMEKGGVLEVIMQGLLLPPEAIAGTPLFKDMQPGPYVELRVRDTGCGMEPQVMERIFEPFFTTRGPEKSSGMGLAVAYGIVKEHGGVIRAASQPGAGTTFQVFLPVAEDAALVESEPVVAEPLAKPVERILFVDDDADFFEVGKQMLVELGYEVVSHDNSLEALAEFEAQPDSFDLVISDQTMPGLTGLELAEACFRLRPDTPFVLATGYVETIQPETVRNMGIREVLAKPFNLRQIGDVIKNI
jgi:PAS domain S-box-containing protein